MKVATRLPDDGEHDHVLHTAILTFMSDMGVIMGARPPSQGMGFEGFMGASLDHALWFHRPVRVDDWLFLDLHAVSNSNSRGLVRGTMHDRAGRLVMSLTQEALLRAARPGMPPPPPPAPPEVP